MAKRQTAYVFYDVKRQRRGAPLASDDIGDDQRIKHSDDDGPGLTRPIYYCRPTVPIVKFIVFLQLTLIRDDVLQLAKLYFLLKQRKYL